MEASDQIRIAASISGLTTISDRHFRVKQASAVSYPEGGHRLLADLEERSFWFNHRNDVILAAVRKFPPGGILYDVGGGNGFVSLALKRAGYQPVVIEPGPLAAQTVLDRGLTLVEGSFENLSVTPESMDSICAFDVIEHIEDHLAAARSFYNALKPGGLLYATVPALDWLWSDDDVSAGHFRRYSKTEFEALLRRAGFQAEYMTYFFSPLVAPVFLMRALPSHFRRIPKIITADTLKREHPASESIAVRLLKGALRSEIHSVETGNTVKIGTSVLAIARKR